MFFLCLGLILYLNLQDAETSMNLSNKTGEVVTAVVMDVLDGKVYW